jgi:hypothetical protein
MFNVSFVYYLTVAFFIAVLIRVIILWRRRYRLHAEMMREQEHQNQHAIAVPTIAYPRNFSSTAVPADAVAVVVAEPRGYYGSHFVGNNYGNLPPLADALQVSYGNGGAIFVTTPAAYGS